MLSFGELLRMFIGILANTLLHVMIKRTIAILLLAFATYCFGGNVQEGKDESQELMDATLLLAEKLLTEHGEFFPYGGAMTPEGKIVSVAAYDDDEHPPSAEVIDMLQKAFQTAAKNKEYKATTSFTMLESSYPMANLLML
ncbi:hypothetical protein [Shewanella phaeophyticola]|uniref:Uncharacterized protein n=1 Tax=Shewanella phaeophyticola TaxID=2978345 RepID=A0ABT2P3H0_9GAMM|nr:hypothetical protein [Shewanella sp. KJ10-1]MCT8985930.1 hypothetical protein [Shewanella sp. KJ10-1]